MTKVRTDVLVVGTGPAGGAVSIALAREGVQVMTINKFPWTCRTPRAHITNQRAMEFLRDAGLEEAGLKHATRQECMGENLFCTSLAGEEFARLKTWGNHPARRADYTLASPTELCDIPQNLMEPMLAGEAARLGAKLRFDTEYLEHHQTNDGVVSRCRDNVTGTEIEVRSRYLVGADGGNSKVARDAGLPFEGQMGLAGSMNIVFEADLSRFVAHRPSVLYWILQPGSDVGGLGMGIVRMVRPWHRWLAIWGYDIDDGPPELTEEGAKRLLHQMIGDEEVEIEIESTSTWTVNDMHATRNTEGRVFIAGDAAHRHPPTNGLGSNTSIMDAWNLGWKIAMVVKGHAGEGLLDSYDAERTPVARQVVKRANKSIGDYPPIFDALGMLGAKNPQEMRDNMEARKEATPEAKARRARLRYAIAVKSYEFNCHGVEMNQRYESDAVLTGGQPMPPFERDAELYHQPTTWPGAHLPHVWLTQVGRREQVSTLDLVGRGRFVLLTGIGGGAWVEAARRIAEETTLPIETTTIGPGCDHEDVYGDFARMRETEDEGALLVRPDQFVAWRSTGLPDDPEAELRRVLTHVLSKPY